MFADKLRILRKDKGLTQAGLSKILGVSPSTIGMYEQGRREPDSKMLIKTAEFFDVPAGYLIGNEDSLKTQNIEEITDLFVKMLRKKKSLFFKGRQLNDEEVEQIITLLKEGLIEAVEND